MLRMLQWAGLIGTVIVIAVLAWPEEAEAGFTVESSAMITDYEGAVPLTIVTDEKAGALTLLVTAEVVRLPDQPEVPIGLAVNYQSTGHALREGIGLKLKTTGDIRAELVIRTPHDLHVRVETRTGGELADLQIGASVHGNEVVLKW